MLSRLKDWSRDDKELYLIILVVYIWLLWSIPDVWFSNIPYRLYALDRMVWFIVLLLVTDLTYCYHEYGLVLDFRRDFNFYMSLLIVILIVLFFVNLILFF